MRGGRGAELEWFSAETAVEQLTPTLGAMANQLLLADPGDFGADLKNLNADTLKDVFELKNPVTGVLINATCALSGQC